MAGNVLRFRGKWYFRGPLGNWWLVNTLRQDQEVDATDRVRVTDSELEANLEYVHSVIQDGTLPAHITDLEYQVPISAADILQAVRHRPDQ